MRSEIESPTLPPSEAPLPATPLDNVARDVMPREVATEMLATPRALRTNRERKLARQARDIVRPSLAPIITDRRGAYFYSQDKSTTREEKIARKLQSKPMARICAWIVRAILRRTACQNAYQKLSEDDQRGSAGRALSVKARLLDAARDGLADELQRRVEAQVALKP